MTSLRSQKKFGYKEILCSKNCAFKSFGSEKFGVKNNFGQKILGQKNCVIVKFWIKNDFGSKILDLRRVLSPRYFWVQIILDPKSLGLTRWWAKICLTPKKLCPKRLVEILSDIADIDKCHQDKCHPDEWHIVRWPQKPTFKV